MQPSQLFLAVTFALPAAALQLHSANDASVHFLQPTLQHGEGSPVSRLSRDGQGSPVSRLSPDDVDDEVDAQFLTVVDGNGYLDTKDWEQNFNAAIRRRRNDNSARPPGSKLFNKY